ncbi:diacylglycerol kinase family protein [Rubinisphaera margarita]|uniref:diacylglycerol kinase family protein n=1 Tax=Rubinisphaera margarita TaxID=2909586 RepID=UPI001EE9319E|nr:diacylglycerol kinase family protein [Rubinisphaera margarita]MCG6155770.1 diacylglycerol kinase family protein [Rubinisphaera margarita]
MTTADPQPGEPQRHRQISLPAAFGCAFRGLTGALKRERNLKIMVAFAIPVFILGAVLTLAPWEWIVLILTIAFVLVSELLNTALERTLDRIGLEDHPLTGEAKDIAAGAVLLSSMTAVVIGVIIFGPKLFALLK